MAQIIQIKLHDYKTGRTILVPNSVEWGFQDEDTPALLHWKGNEEVITVRVKETISQIKKIINDKNSEMI